MSDKKPVSKAEDDIFAFGGVDFDLPPAKKAKTSGKKKRHHHHHRAKTATASSSPRVNTSRGRSTSSFSSTTSPDLEEIRMPEKDQETDELYKMLGLTADEIPTPVRRARKPVEYDDDDDSDDNQDDQLLRELDSEILKVKKLPELAVEEGSPSAETEKSVLIGGEMVPVSQVKFEIALTLQVPGYEKTIMVKVPGKTQFRSIQRSSVKYAATAEPPIQIQNPERLVFFISELDLVVKQVLKVGTLLGMSAKKLPLNADKSAYTFQATLTSEENAEASREMMMLSKTDITLEESEHEEEERIVVLKDRKTSEQTEVTATGESELQDLVSIFLVRMKYPETLDVTLYDSKGEEVEDLLAKVSSLEPAQKYTFEIDYDQAQLDELGKMTDTQDDHDDELSQATETAENAGDSEAGYFTINMMGEDRKSYKVQVNSNTTVTSMIEYYKKKAGIAAGKRIQLLFDDEELSPNTTVGETELEEDYLVDVLIH